MLIVGVGLREKFDFSCRLMHALGDSAVIANHFDDWHAPPVDDPGDQEGLQPFADEIHRCAPHTRVLIPSHFAAIAVP